MPNDAPDTPPKSRTAPDKHSLVQPIKPVPTRAAPSGPRLDGVLAAEREEILLRRKKLGTLAHADTRRNDSLGSLTGLALSGGGIRSAIFNLGVVQELARRGVFKHIDYLSTVSGGGYLGCSLSAQLSHADARYPDDMLSSDAMEQLRRSSNYLAPGGAIDALRIPALLLRGIVVNILVLFPYLVVAAGLMDLALGDKLREIALGGNSIRDFFPAITVGGDRMAIYLPLTAIAALTVLAWMAMTPLVQWLAVRRWAVVNLARMRDLYDRTFAWGIALVLVALVLDALPAALAAFIAWDFSDLTKNLGVLLALILPYVAAGKAAGAIGMLRGKVGLWLLGVLAPVLLVLMYVNVGYWTIYERETWLYWTAPVIWLLTWMFVNVNLTSLHPFYRDRLSKAFLFETRRPRPRDDCAAHDAARAVDVPACADRASTLLSEINEGHQAPYHLINCACNISGPNDATARSRQADFFIFSKHFVGSSSTGYCRTADIEEADPHLNLGTAMAISGAAAAPNAGVTTIGPLVLLMALLNVRLGYWLPNPRFVKERPSEESKGNRLKWMVEKVKKSPHWILGSGPGPVYLVYEALKQNRAERALVNVSDGGHIENLGIYELLRRRCRFIIASDAEADAKVTFGSLAALIRYARIDLGIEIDIDLTEIRRNQEGLSRRHCTLGRIYYPGGEIGQLVYIKSSVSGTESEVIREYRTRNASFPHETTADQFFDEAQFEAYRSLGQQCAQSLFEGACSMQFTERMHIEEWFNRLRLVLRPQYASTSMFIALQNQLGSIQRALADRDLAAYTHQLYPEIHPERPEIDSRRSRESAFARSVDPLLVAEATFNAEHLHKLVHVCNMQFELMENVFIALELDRERNRQHHVNRGWMNLFRRWSQAPYFRLMWSFSIGTYSVGFQHFCREQLGLDKHFHIEWEQSAEAALTHAEQHVVAEAQMLLEPEVPGAQQTRLDVRVAHAVMALGRGSGGDIVWFRFPVGFVALVETADRWQIRSYRTRDFYRGMDLWDYMLHALRQELSPDGVKPRRLEVFFSADQREHAARYRHVFERHGFEIDGETDRALKSAPVPRAQSITEALIAVRAEQSAVSSSTPLS